MSFLEANHKSWYVRRQTVTTRAYFKILQKSYFITIQCIFRFIKNSIELLKSLLEQNLKGNDELKIHFG